MTHSRDNLQRDATIRPRNQRPGPLSRAPVETADGSVAARRTGSWQ